MPNYKFTSGPYRGRTTAEGATILDVSFANLPYEIQNAVVAHSEIQAEDSTAAELAAAVRSFENSWGSEETEDQIDLLPLSQ
jgi:hypothetical protein